MLNVHCRSSALPGLGRILSRQLRRLGLLVFVSLCILALASCAALQQGQTVPPAIEVILSSLSATLQVSQSQPFSVTVQNDSQNLGVSWTLSGTGCTGSACGTLTNVTTTSVSYTAPATPPSPPTVSLKATSLADTTKSGSVTITVMTPAPSISNLSPNSGVVGTTVTVTGANFGASQGTSTVKFNGTTATATSWSATSIVAPVPAGATTGNVVVTVGGVASNSASFTVTVPAPSIASLNPTSGVLGTSVTIAGTNFGATQGTSTVKFNGIAGTPTSWSATGIAVPVPAGATTGNVVVTVGGVASNGVAFTVTSPGPSITSLNPASGVIGTSVTISGANFGATQGTSTVKFNGTAATPTSWSATSIVAPVPAGATTGNVVVTVAGAASNGISFTVTLPAPAISNLTPNSGQAGASITIAGTNFGATKGSSTVKFNGTTATPTSWSATSIVAPVPPTATTGNVVVTVGGAASNAVAFTVLPDTTPPSVPTGLTATAVSSSQINLSWTPSTDNVGVTGYDVYRNGTNIGTSLTNSDSDTGLAASTTYTYTVAAHDAAGNASAQSATASATTAASSGGTGTPTLVWSKSGANTTGDNTNSYTTNLPTTGTLPGNAVIAAFQYGSGPSASVTDDKGDTFTLLASNSDGNQTLSTYCVLPTPGARTLTITFSGGAPQWVSLVNASEWLNLSCSLDGSSSNNDSNTLTASVTAGNFSTTTDGDLLYQAAIEDGSTGSETWTAGAAPWTLLSASSGLAGANSPQASQYQLQTTHGSINPTLSMTSQDTWVSVAVALKASSSGTAPAAGIRIVHMQEESLPPGSPSNFSLQFPSSGNLLITAVIDSPDFDVVTITDNKSNTHAQIGSAFNDGSTSGDVQTFYVANAATSSTLKLTYAMTGSPIGGSDFFLFDVTGASSTPYDATAGRKTATAPLGVGTLPGPTITPSTANGLIIIQVAVTSFTIDAISPGFFAGTIPNPVGQTNPTNQNNGWAFDFNATATARQYTWTSFPAGSQVEGWASTAVAFKAP